MDEHDFLTLAERYFYEISIGTDYSRGLARGLLSAIYITSTHIDIDAIGFWTSGICQSAVMQ